MLGGYQILDLRKIDLTITKTQSNITNAYVLSQLLKLRDFIDKDYDFSKPIENQLKPVLIRYRDKKNGEKSEGAMFGELAVVDNYYTFKITGRISGYLILTIKVAFQETTNAYGAKEWVINTAKIKLQDVMDDLEGNLALEGDLDVSGDLDIGGDVTVDEDSKVKIFENITDAEGHKRFDEGELTVINDLADLSPFAHWSLSGSHLMLVLCIYNNTEEDITVSGASELANVELPSWIADKIYPMGSSGHVAQKTGIKGLYPSTLTESSTSVTAYLLKSSNTLYISGINVTFEAGDYYRIEFDLIIDNNQE